MQININVSEDIINNALIGAREGAVSYWATSRVFSFDSAEARNTFELKEVGGYCLWENKEYNEYFKSKKKTFNKAFQSFTDITGENPNKILRNKELFVTYAKVQSGLEIMSKEYSSHFGDLMAEQDDAVTHDVFVQCCLFGKIIYG